MPKISIIIPTYNSATYIEETLESVLDQTFHDYEIIVINDGSTDNTKKRLQKYRDRISYLEQKQSGPGAARNNGILFSSGEYIVCLDSDDMLKRDALKKVIEIFEKTNCGWIIEDIDRTNHALKYKANLYKERDFLMSFLRQEFIFQSRFYKKDVLLRIGLFDPLQFYYEDWDLWIRLLKENCAFFYSEDQLYIYNKRAGSITKQKNKNRNYFYLERLYKKHYKSLADNGSREAAELYSHFMWEMAREYFCGAKNFIRAIMCMQQSARYDNSNLKCCIKKYVSKFIKKNA